MQPFVSSTNDIVLLENSTLIIGGTKIGVLHKIGDHYRCYILLHRLKSEYLGLGFPLPVAVVEWLQKHTSDFSVYFQDKMSSSMYKAKPYAGFMKRKANPVRVGMRRMHCYFVMLSETEHSSTDVVVKPPRKRKPKTVATRSRYARK